MLSIHVLNVGHGDSIVLQYKKDAETESVFAVIDSNAKAGQVPKALEKLRQLGAKQLSFLALTHPHKDHYAGLSQIVDEYIGRISNIYTYPIDRREERLKKLLEIYKNYSITDGTKISDSALEFVKAITSFARAAKAGAGWETPLGNRDQLLCLGMSPDVQLFALLPLARVKGSYYQAIDNGTLEPEKNTDNELSLALLVSYRGHNIILGGDAARAGWLEQKRFINGLEIEHGSSVAKLPHHGSKIDCDSNVIDVIYSGETPNPEMAKVALISANGHSHPATEVLNALSGSGIMPYCTNLSRQCGANIRILQSSNSTDPALMRFIASVASGEDAYAVQPCQGDICVTIDDAGKLSVSTEYNHPCVFRGGYSFLI